MSQTSLTQRKWAAPRPAPPSGEDEELISGPAARPAAPSPPGAEYSSELTLGTPRIAPPRMHLPGTIRISNPGWCVGTGQHRSGWPYAMRMLRSLISQDGLLLDDFVERSFSYYPVARPYDEPWVGIFHHPPNMPYFTGLQGRHENIFESRLWKESVRHLKLAIALSKYARENLERALSVPTATVYHPTETPRKTWSPDAYAENRNQELLQIGWYLRNTRAIYQLPALARHRKVRLLIRGVWTMNYDRRVREHWRLSGRRREYGGVKDRAYVSADRYDDLLSQNVVFTEVFDASANNVVVECIVRDTPLIVNRHPALTEYLTPDYPLFFDELGEVPRLLEDDRVLAGHHYLTEMDKSHLSGDFFRESMRRLVASVPPTE